MKIKKYLVFKNYKNYFKYRLGKKYRKSFAQCGEDLIMDYALKNLDIATPTFLDVGTNLPALNNNTFFFYKRGSHGVCIEPDPELFKAVQKERKNDVCLNVGIGSADNSSADYYVMSSKALSTFVKDEAEKCVHDSNYGKQKIEKIIKIPLVSINGILKKYFPLPPDILSLDTEGFDFEIIKSLDFQNFRPKIICVETARFGNNKKVEKRTDIISYLENQNYWLFADTFVNSIFVDKDYKDRIH
jgi:FkbM family methyltransferase